MGIFGYRMADIGSWGAFRMGLKHGGYCLGCCWALMGLLFAFGVMNLLWVACISGFVLLEKITSGNRLISRLGGLLFIGWGSLDCFCLVKLRQLYRSVHSAGKGSVKNGAKNFIFKGATPLTPGTLSKASIRNRLVRPDCSRQADAQRAQSLVTNSTSFVIGFLCSHIR